VIPEDVVTIAGDLGSGVRLIETPLINSVGDFGMPVSDSYSFELSVSNWRPLLVLATVLPETLTLTFLGDLQIRIRKPVDPHPPPAFPPVCLNPFRWASSKEFAPNDFTEETIDGPPDVPMLLFFPLINPTSLPLLTSVSKTLLLSKFSVGFISRSENEFLSVLLELAPLLSSSIYPFPSSSSSVMVPETIC
jgi:hypothetical protein